MNEQELRENIARIVAKHLCKNKYSHFQLYGDSANCYSRENFAECEAIADTVDALIAAGIGDVSEWKHRAEVAERAVREFAVQVGCKSCPFYCRCGIDSPNAKNDYQECYEACGKQKKNCRRKGKMTEQEMVQKIYEVIKLVDCMQHNPSVDFNYLRAKCAYNIIKNQVEHIESENEQLKQTLSKMETVEKDLKARLEKAVELPCKVGDSAYYIQKCKIYYGTVVCLYFSSSGVKEIGVELPSLNIDEYEYMPSSYCIEKKEIGKTLFFTKQAAEARLAELRGEK